MNPIPTRRRTRLATRRRPAARGLSAPLLAVAIAAAAAAVLPSAIAAGNSGRRHLGRATASGTAVPAAAREIAAVQQLASDGTINQQQASAVDDQINSRSIDPGQLLKNDVLTEAQADAVADAIKNAAGAIKSGAGGAKGSGGSSGKGDAGPPGSGESKGAAGENGSGGTKGSAGSGSGR